MKYLGKIQDNKDLVTKEYVDGRVIHSVIGTQTASTGSWTGVIDVPALYDGLTIAYYLPYAGSGNATLNLTLSGGGTTGAVNCYYNANNRLTTHFSVGTVIYMTYWSAGSIKVSGTATTDNRWVSLADYNSDGTGYYTRKIYPNIKAGSTKIFPYTLIMQLPDGRWESIVTSSSSGTSKARNTHGFLLGHVLCMYANATYNENDNVGTYNIWSAHSGLIDHRYSFNTANNSTSGTTGYKPIYLVGTVLNGLFYLDSTWWTQILPSSDDGKVYVYIGDAYDYYRMTLAEEAPAYIYKSGGLRLYSGHADTVNGHTVATSVPAGAVFTDTDTKVTAVGNHYTPSGGTTTSASGATGTAGSTVQVVTGITKDAAGHVTGITSGAATDTTYNFSGTTFYSGASGTAEHNANNAVKNGNYYYTSNGPTTSLGASSTDGALYVQSYSDSWVGQIAQDYRNGRLFVRGKNNGTWQSWMKIYDSGNLTSQSAASGGTAVSLVTTGEKYTWNNKGTSNLALGETSSTAYRGDRGKTAYDHSQATHARTDATAVTASTTNGKIKINGTDTTVYTHPSTTAASAAAVKVGKDASGHVVLGNALTASDVSAVPTTRTINGLGLSSDVVLTASDIDSVGIAPSPHGDPVTLADDLDTLSTSIAGKQATLVSGTNIKTINNTSILGSGNISISGGGGGTVTSVGISNATDGGMSISGSPVTGSGSITIGHSNVLTSAQTTQAIYPIKIDKNGHISAYGTAVDSKTAASGGTDVSLVTTGEKYTWNNKQAALSTSAVTPTCTASTGTKVSAEMRKYGNVVQFTLTFKNTSSVASGSNVFVGTLSTNKPLQTISSVGYYGSAALPMSINSSGAITVRNAGASAVTCSSNTVIGATWLV